MTGLTPVSFDFDPTNKAKTTDSNVAAVIDGDVTDILDSVVDGSYTLAYGTCDQPISTLWKSELSGRTRTPPLPDLARCGTTS